MYDNIGGKIKGLAKAVFIVEAIAAVITGIALMAIDEDLILFGILTLILGPVIAWVSSWLLYGFGELIDKACKIEYNTRMETKKGEVKFNGDSERIKRLESLRAKGLISEEEYQRATSKEVSK